MLLKLIKRFKQGSLCNFKEKNNKLQCIVYIININMKNSKKINENLPLDVKTYFYFLREQGFDTKIL